MGLLTSGREGFTTGQIGSVDRLSYSEHSIYHVLSHIIAKKHQALTMIQLTFIHSRNWGLGDSVGVRNGYVYMPSIFFF